MFTLPFCRPFGPAFAHFVDQGRRASRRAPGYPIAAPPALRTTKPRRCVTIVIFNFVKETFCNALSGNYDSSDARGFDAAWV
jgi:hypothetical protein